METMLIIFPHAELTETSPNGWVKHWVKFRTNLLLRKPERSKAMESTIEDLEDELKPNTLWRAPHASTTVGIPSVRIHANWIVDAEGEHRALPLNQSVSELLLCGTERLPGLGYSS